MSVINTLMANKAIVLGVLFGISEALSFIPSIKANGVFQLIFGWLSKAVPQNPQTPGQGS